MMTTETPKRRGWPRPRPNPNAISTEQIRGRTGAVVALHVHQAHRAPMIEVTTVEGQRNGGLIGDSHVLRRNRAVTLVDRTTLDDLGLQPGDLREQITISGLPEITNLARGTRIAVGGLTLRINGVCEPCVHIGKMLGVEDPEAFRQALQGRRGAVATIVAARGPAAVGDAVEVLPAKTDSRKSRVAEPVSPALTLSESAGIGMPLGVEAR
jgi:MOSC domain-containing protein YiiM